MVRRVNGFVLTDKIFLKDGGMFDWWEEIDESEEWQRSIFYFLSASYAFVSFVALVVSFFLSFYSAAFSCLIVINFFQWKKKWNWKETMWSNVNLKAWIFTCMHVIYMVSKLESLLQYRFDFCSFVIVLHVFKFSRREWFHSELQCSFVWKKILIFIPNILLSIHFVGDSSFRYLWMLLLECSLHYPGN